ncbi:hypothetical protein FHX52_0692 [Humibacillus xanthopallidus]|uniref:DUF456 family protein n=1 Tax=Humibacillus xanthopallidus TaxID=412689 RepID=A0A543PU42_9MICO|nr:DUF456 domain-containing protein [Humibacillus xanthopallidus]TQN47589.1 hypothetical protein FHX52_0692 [Humibacillus xanthopallidus]
MITGTNVLVGIVMLIGTVGIVAPVLPGLFLVWAATLLWAIEVHSTAGWITFAIATLLYAAGLVAQYLLPGRRMKRAGVDSRFVAVALVVAVVGFFVIPVIGAAIGFVATIFLLELAKHRSAGVAWHATVHAIKAVGLNIGLELGTAFAIITTWAIAVYLTRP